MSNDPNVAITPEAEAIKLARSIGDNLARKAKEGVARLDVDTASPWQLREQAGRLFVLARRREGARP